MIIYKDRIKVTKKLGLKNVFSRGLNFMDFKNFILLIIVCIFWTLPCFVMASEKVVSDADKNAAPSDVSGIRNLRHNADLFVSVQDALEMLGQKNKVFLVDVRPRNAFDAFRIPGSINIPAYAVKTKTQLKNRSVILINQGHSYKCLEQTCENLKTLGFSARIMAGGLNGWRQAGGPLEGDFFAQKELNRVGPRSFYEEKNYANWLVIDATGIAADEVQRLIPEAQQVSKSEGMDAVAAQVAERGRKFEQDPLFSVIIFDEHGKTYDTMEKALKKGQLQNICFLSGGFRNYEKYLKEQAVIGSHEKGKRISIRKCATCQ